MLSQATRVVLVEVEPRTDDAGHPSQATEAGARGEVSDDVLDIPQPTQGRLRPRILGQGSEIARQGGPLRLCRCLDVLDMVT